MFWGRICQAVQSCMNWSSPGQALFAQPISPKIPWKIQPWSRLGVTALPTFHGFNLPKHPEKQSKKLQNWSQLHPSARSCYPAQGEDFNKQKKSTQIRHFDLAASTSAETRQQKAVENMENTHPAEAVPRDHLYASIRKCHHLNVEGSAIKPCLPCASMNETKKRSLLTRSTLMVWCPARSNHRQKARQREKGVATSL